MCRLHEGRVAIVTGANAGLGLEISKELVRHGAKVTLLARNVEKLIASAEEIRSEIPGAEVITVSADVTSEADFQRAVNETLEAFGTVDYLVNNAGLDKPVAAILDCEISDFKAIVDVSLTGAAIGIKAAAPIMLAKGKGSIVNITSVCGLTGSKDMPAYVSAKHGLAGLTKSVGIDFGPKGVRVNATAPGGIMTDMLQDTLSTMGEMVGMSGQEMIDLVASRSVLRRFSSPSEQAKAVSFLLSDDASYINATVVPVDGGICSQSSANND